MLVIRVKRNGELANSKPCIQCLVMMATRLPTKGYCVSDVYFSNANGTLSVQSLNNLLFKDEHYLTQYHQERGTKISLAKL